MISREERRLWRAVQDACLPRDTSLTLVYQAPSRWDELLDTRLPLVISSEVGAVDTLLANLDLAGLPKQTPLRLVEGDGEVRKLDPFNPIMPRTQDWALLVGWTHPDEGWRARLPLWGKRYLVTREKSQGQTLVQQLQTLGAEAEVCPTIAFTEPDDLAAWEQALANLENYDWVIFTSVNGVKHFMALLTKSGKDLRALSQARLACIGPATAKALESFALKADLLPEEFVAEGLLEAFHKLDPEPLATLRILLPRAQEAREVLPETLRQSGAEVDVVPVYKTITPSWSAELKDKLTAETRLLFTASSTVKNWMQMTSNCQLGCFCIGPITAQTARDLGFEVLGVADEYTVDGLLDKLLEIDGKRDSTKVR